MEVLTGHKPNTTAGCICMDLWLSNGVPVALQTLVRVSGCARLRMHYRYSTFGVKHIPVLAQATNDTRVSRLIIPGSHSILESICVVALVDDTSLPYAQLPGRTGGGQSVHGHGRHRRSVNVENLRLTRVGTETCLSIVLVHDQRVTNPDACQETAHTWKKL